MQVSVSIIGSARDTRLSRESYHKMLHCGEQYILSEISSDWKRIHLVSGGAAWSDHLAVALFLKHPECTLSLHLPCEWDEKKTQHHDNTHPSWQRNPGHLANKYHIIFSRQIKQDTLKQIELARVRGATIQAHQGFHKRNLHVGKSQYLLAFTFSSGDQPEQGGTLHTWKNSKHSKKKHFCISRLPAFDDLAVVS